MRMGVRISLGPPIQNAPVADGEAGGLQTRPWRFESAPECHAGDAEGGEAAVRKTALNRFKSGLLFHAERKGSKAAHPPRKRTHRKGT